jgi:hypothetical protein
MANDSRGAGIPGEFAAWLGRLLIALVAGEDLRVRQVIARAAAGAHFGQGLDSKARRHAGHDPVARPQVE